MGLFDRFRRTDDRPETEHAGEPGDAQHAGERDGGPAEVDVDAFAGLRERAQDGADTDEQRAEIARVLRTHGVPDPATTAFVGDMVDGITLAEDGPADERLRLGGPPVLPAGEPWPTNHDGRPLSFVAALDLAAVPPVAPLPRAGILSVFWDEDFADDDRMDFVTATRVFLLPPGAPSTTAEPPARTAAFGPVPLRAVRMPFVVDADRLRDDVPDDVPGYDLLDTLLQEYGHALLGASRDIQGPVLDEVAYWFEQGHPETRERYSPAELRGEGWAFLAQIDETAGLTFGDVGALYLVLPRADLEAGRFDRVMGIMQCS